MNATYRLVTVILTVSALATLASCGGGGSGGSTPPAPTPTPTPKVKPTGAPTTCSSIAANGRRPVNVSRLSSWVVPNRLYVTYHAQSGRGPQTIDRLAGAEQAVDIGVDGGLARRALTLPDGVDATKVAAQLRASAEVVDVQPVHVRVPLGVSSPNDPFFNNVDQWYLFRTDVTPDAWAIDPDGSGVSIAVIDTGIDEKNVDLTTKVDVRERVVAGALSTGPGTVQDSNGHGTNVAGLAATATNNGIGFAGVGFNARLQIYKIFPDATATSDCQTADTLDEARAIRDAVANGASVINLSLGAAPATGFDQAEHDAVVAAIAAGVTVVAAGGNDNGTSPDYPGGYAGVISVGASSVQDAVPNTYASITRDTVASYSNSGVTLIAPGGDPSGTSDQDRLHWVEGYSTSTAAYPPDQCSTPSPASSCRALFAGTSQSTPIVAGTVALMMAYHGGPKSLSPATVTQLLKQNADTLSSVASTQQGAGRLNAGRAVAAAHP